MNYMTGLFILNLLFIVVLHYTRTLYEIVTTTDVDLTANGNPLN